MTARSKGHSIAGLVNKVDIHNPLGHWGGIIGAMLLGMVAGGALGIGLRLRRGGRLTLLEPVVPGLEGKTLLGKYEQLLPHAGDAILVLDADGFILEANDRAVEYYGRTQSEFQKLRMQDLFVLEMADESKRLFDGIKRLGRERIESVHCRKDGSTFPVQISAQLLDFEAKAFVFTVIEDITERRTRERDLEKVTQLYAALSQVDQAIIWTQSREELFSKVCQALVKYGSYKMAWIGWKESDDSRVAVVGKSGDGEGYFQNVLVRYDETPLGQEPVGVAIREGRPCVLNDFQCVAEGMPWRAAAVRSGFEAIGAFPIRLGGVTCGALAVYNGQAGCFGEKEVPLLLEAAMDVSFALDHLAGEDEHRQGEVALKESLAFNQTLIETIPFGMDIVDEQGNILFLNPAMKALLGQSALGGRCWLFYKDDKEQCTACPLRQRIEVGRTTTLESNGVLGGRCFLITHTGMLYKGKAALLEIFYDITARKQAEAESLELTAQLHQSQKLESMGSLAGGIAHDINNVLGAILSLASVHRENLGEADILAKSLDTIISACLRGRDVVRSLLYFARKDLVTVGPVDLNALVRGIVQLLARTTLQRIHLDMDLQDPLAPIRGDAAALSHALMNLCVNSMDAMPDGGAIFLRTCQLLDGQVQLSVRDTGEGMTPEIKKRALEPFFTTKPQGKGTGLGLSMVFETMTSHQGSMEIISERGQGTEILLRFPALEGEWVLATPEPPPGEALLSQGALSILLVDDDELIRDAVGPMLEILGHRVQSVDSGLGALSLFEEGLEVDLVILDMNMPGINGAETLHRLLMLRPDQRVIMASGYSDHDMQKLLDGRPMVTSIQKPFSLQEIQSKLVLLKFFPNPGEEAL